MLRLYRPSGMPCTTCGCDPRRQPFYAILRQPRSSLGPVERGYSLCLTPAGRLTHGPVSYGTPTRVVVEVRCPPGSEFVGLYHTHPGGTSRPSSMDIEAARRVGARVICIRGEDGLRCWRVT